MDPSLLEKSHPLFTTAVRDVETFLVELSGDDRASALGSLRNMASIAAHKDSDGVLMALRFLLLKSPVERYATYVHLAQGTLSEGGEASAEFAAYVRMRAREILDVRRQTQLQCAHVMQEIEESHDLLLHRALGDHLSLYPRMQRYAQGLASRMSGERSDVASEAAEAEIDDLLDQIGAPPTLRAICGHPRTPLLPGSATNALSLDLPPLPPRGARSAPKQTQAAASNASASTLGRAE